MLVDVKNLLKHQNAIQKNLLHVFVKELVHYFLALVLLAFYFRDIVFEHLGSEHKQLKL